MNIIERAMARPSPFKQLDPLYQVGYITPDGRHQSTVTRATSQFKAWQNVSSLLGADYQVNTPLKIG